MKALVAVDDSKWSGAAIAAIERLVWPAGTEMIVLSVAPTQGAYILGEFPDVPPIFASENLERERQSHEQVAKRYAQRLRETCSTLRTEVEVGDPREAIVECAKRENADLIIVGSHGRSGLKKLLLGSVSSYVVSHAPCNVLIAKSKESD